MAGPRFRFASLLRIRKHEEEQRALTLSRTERQVYEQLEERDQIRAEHERALLHTSAEVNAAFDASELRRYHQYERYLSRLSDDKDGQIQALQAQAGAERERLLDALKKRRTLERLKEKHLLEYARGRRILEQKMLDEIASIQQHQPQFPRPGSEDRTEERPT